MVLLGGLIAVIVNAGHAFAPAPELRPSPFTVTEPLARFILTQLGSPPSFEKGQQIAEQVGLSIRIEANAWTWSSSDQLPPLATVPNVPPLRSSLKGDEALQWMPSLFLPLRRYFTSATASRALASASLPDHYVKFAHQFSDGPATVFMAAPFSQRSEKPLAEALSSAVDMPLAIMWAQILGIFSVAGLFFLLMRWVLFPIAVLKEGVQAIAEGHLDYRVPITSSDEVGLLTYNFNEMAHSVKQMFEAKRQPLLEVSHSLLSPLGRAKISLQQIQSSEAKAQVAADLLEIENMVNHLLESARHENGHGLIRRETIDLVALTKEVVKSYAELGKPVAITEHPATLMVRVDVDALKRVLRNLIENALNHSPEGKSVSVGLTQQPQRARWQVRDEGVGIAKEELARVFQPFYRGAKSEIQKKGGLGLGLSLCKRIVEAHGGTIQLESTAERGTSAIVAIPL